jgi:large subunit ribosomal protein L24
MPNLVKTKMNRLAAATPAPKVKIRRGDRVLVLTGVNRGDVARVIEVDPVKGMARVEGVRMVKKHQKPDRARGRQGGIVQMEAPISLSNLKLVCPSCGQPTRVGRTVLNDGKIVRVCKRKKPKECGAIIDRQS